MIQLNKLSKQLNKVLDEQTKYCVLCNKDGSMIAYAGPDRVYAKNLSSLVSNIWAGYDRMGASAGNDVESLILDCESGNVVVLNVGKIILSIVGSSDLGISRLKIKAVKKDLLSIL